VVSTETQHGFAEEGAPDLLRGVRVLDLTSGRAEMTSRYLADLGAEVLRVGVPGRDDEDGRAAAFGPSSLHHLTHNANKHQARIDLAAPAGRAELEVLLGAADLLVEDTAPGTLDAFGLAPADLLRRHPQLVVISVTDFGQTGPYRDWVGSEWTHLAMGAVLSRSGIPGEPPLLPPGSLATEGTAIQAAFAGLVAYANRLETGIGDHVDVSVYEATGQVLDPGYGIGGTGAAGLRAPGADRGRPDARHLYPIFPCADGHVRVCLLSARQWRGMRAWMGEPAELADPGLENLMTRFAAVDLIYPLIGVLFAAQSRDDLVAAGQGFGVPIAALLSPAEVLAAEHFERRRAFTTLPSASGRSVRVPNGFVEINGVRAGLRRPAPGPDDHDAGLVASWSEVAGAGRAAEPGVAGSSGPAHRRHPLAGMRILDLGVIVVGAELGRLLADQGADVIKVENREFPDGSRQATNDQMTGSFAAGHRNKRSLGLNLRHPDGLALFLDLVARSDAVLSNFKPGTMSSLGLGYEELAKANPRIVLAESSALGADGPWSKRMGYGPLVRASTALTGLWAYPDVEEGFSDASTIYPDHAAARIGAVAVLAALLDARRSGRGAHIRVSQAETMIGQFADMFALESIQPGSMVARGNVGPGDAPRGLYRCAGEDEWCVVDIRGDGDWARLSRLIGRPQLAADTRYQSAAARVEHRLEVDDLVGEWLAALPPREAMTRLQSAGVPAGMMQRVNDLPGDEHLVARGFFDVLAQPQLRRPLVVERAPAHFGGVADPPENPAPLLGEHTRPVCREVLGLSDGEIDDLLAAGVLEGPKPVLPAASTATTE
jgi:crotonobetainyl-CoA:carnitine CoA-transferase CaiB-like acyl-CoA transferase